MADRIEIDADVRRARTLPASFYRDAAMWERSKDRVFARSWLVAPPLQAIDTVAAAAKPGHGPLVPFTLLPGFLDEPLLYTRPPGGTAGQVRCISNVCTHRGTVLVSDSCSARKIRCRYHGRTFGLDGTFASMPAFEEAEAFPSPKDDLARLPLARLGPLTFTAIDPAMTFEDLVAPIKERLGWFPVDDLVLDPSASRDYLVQAHWALYCDNYLEGFHVGYVHPGLQESLDVARYRTEVFAHANVQIGVAQPGDGAIFELPAGHPDAGQRIAGYYFWLFPCTMLNFYPWGLSVNLVEPVSIAQTRVRFLIYALPGARRDAGAGSALHQVEMEDESVVEAVQRGIASRIYERGRYSPSQERCVHHFHGLLTAYLA
ncbi:MAG: SRPBCC family protein [Acidobacteriota bacterium]